MVDFFFTSHLTLSERAGHWTQALKPKKFSAASESPLVFAVDAGALHCTRYHGATPATSTDAVPHAWQCPSTLPQIICESRVAAPIRDLTSPLHTRIIHSASDSIVLRASFLETVQSLCLRLLKQSYTTLVPSRHRVSQKIPPQTQLLRPAPPSSTVLVATGPRHESSPMVRTEDLRMHYGRAKA